MMLYYYGNQWDPNSFQINQEGYQEWTVPRTGLLKIAENPQKPNKLQNLFKKSKRARKNLANKAFSITNSFENV